MSFLNHLKCNRYYKLLLPYVEDKLSKEDRITLENHLQKCTHCQTELKLISNVSGVLRASAKEVLPVQDDLWQNIKSEITKETLSNQNFYLKPASVALALVIVLGIFTGLHLKDGQEKSETINHIVALKSAPRKNKSEQNIIVKEKIQRPLVSIAKSPIIKSSKHKTNIITGINKPVMIAKLPEDIKAESPSVAFKKSSIPLDLSEVEENKKVQYRDKKGEESFNRMQSDQDSQPRADQFAIKQSESGQHDSKELVISDKYKLPVSTHKSNDQIISAPSSSLQSKTSKKDSLNRELENAGSSSLGNAAPSNNFATGKTDQVMDIQSLLNKLDKELAGKDHSAALKTIDHIISKNPKDQSVWFKIALTFEMLNEKEKAVNAYKTAMNGQDESISKKAKEKISAIK